MIGKTISHYKILEKIGSGGMGIVYKAQDLKLDRFVALKFLPPHLTSSEEEKQRFIHEAKAASSLDHNNICAIHEIDETKPAPGEPGDGQLFISMAYYEGETLKLKIEKGKGKIEEAVDYTIQIAKGLQEAHQSGIIHRDIKPANIIITNKGEAKVLDFGLAKLKGQTKLTKSGSTAGTVAYMSPEQAKGDEVDHRTDIFSLGVMLYEMISGELPFKGDYDQAVVYSILNEKPEPLNIEIPDALKSIIEKCLEKNPSDRYQDISDLVADLNAIKDGSSTDQSGRQEKRIKIKSIVFTIAVLIFIVIGYLFIPFDVFEKKSDRAFDWENSIAVLPFDNISNDPDQDYFCDGMTEQIISNLSRLPQLKVIARQSMMKFKDTEKTISEIGQELNVAYILESSFRKFGNRIRVTAQLISAKDDFHVWSEDYDKDYSDLLALQDELSELIAISLLQTISGEEIEQIKLNRPKNLKAWEYYSTGSYIHNQFLINIKQIDYFKKSEQMLKKAIELDPDYVPTYAELADLYNTYYNYVASGGTEEEKQKYLNLQKKYINEGFGRDPHSAHMYRVNGSFLETEGDFSRAYDNYKKSLIIEPNNERGNFYIGIFYQQKGLHHLAIEYLSRAIEFNPIYSLAYFNRGWCYILLGNLEEADLDIVKSLEIDPEFDLALGWYAWCLVKMDRITEAKGIIKKREELFPNDDWNNVLKSVMYALTGDREKAFEKYPEGNFYIFVSLKMVDETIDLLSRQIDRHKKSEYSTYLWLSNSPIYDFLRSDPRFQKILKEEKKIYEENLEKYPDIDI